MTDDQNQPQKPVARQIKIGSQRKDISQSTGESLAEPASKPKSAAGGTPPQATSPQATSPPSTQPAKPDNPPNDSVADGATQTQSSNDSAPPATATATPAKPMPTAEELFPASIIDRMTGDMEDELAAELGDLSLDDLMDSGAGTASAVELDKRYDARVIKTDRESVFFSFGGQAEGIAPKRMFDEVPGAGTELQIVPTRYLTDDGLYEVVVPGGSVEVQDWSDLSEGVIVEAKITGHNKGGLECEVNHIRGFMPISHIELFRVEDLEPYVGQSLKCVVTEANESRRNLVVSRRAMLEREREAAREQLLASLEVGQVVEGVVTRLQDFGAFVDLGGIDGLIHVSQLSWDRIQHPNEVLEQGQRVKVKIEKLDPESGRIGLSYRDLLEDPWDGAEQTFGQGNVVEGTVSKIMDFGAFVRLAPGIEGLVHISEIAHHRITKVGAFLKEGQPVTVKVLSMDKESQRISLSMKAALAKPADEQQATSKEDESPAPQPTVPKRNEPLKGGLNRPSGGDEFGLKW